MKSSKHTQGFVFVTALAVMMILLAMGMSYLLIARNDMLNNRNEMTALKAFYEAESGVAHSMAEILNNADSDGNGIGNIMGTDLDTDGDIDYYVNYSDTTKKIIVTGTEGTAVRDMEVEISPKGPWTGAVQVGGNVRISSGNNVNGIVNGNIDARATINKGNLTVNGTITPGNSGLEIPIPDFNQYANPLNFPGISHYSIPNCDSLPENPPAGIYYINGSCTINTPLASFTLNGSIIARGYVSINTIGTGNTTIIAIGDLPAIVAEGHVIVGGVWNPSVTGLIYATNYIQLFSFSGNASITGALVAYTYLDWVEIPNLNLTFNENLNPPYFSTSGGTTGIKVDSWRGHN